MISLSVKGMMLQRTSSCRQMRSKGCRCPQVSKSLNMTDIPKPLGSRAYPPEKGLCSVRVPTTLAISTLFLSPNMTELSRAPVFHACEGQCSRQAPETTSHRGKPHQQLADPRPHEKAKGSSCLFPCMRRLEINPLKSLLRGSSNSGRLELLYYTTGPQALKNLLREAVQPSHTPTLSSQVAHLPSPRLYSFPGTLQEWGSGSPLGPLKSTPWRQKSSWMEVIWEFPLE